MRIDFLGLQAFLSIAQRGNFQRAAAHLNLSQTAISHRMRKLEEDLGIKLFARTTREVTLTRAGIEFLPKAQKAIEELEQSTSRACPPSRCTTCRRS
jgi:DNA-binding transcriptional LysR family regulator